MRQGRRGDSRTDGEAQHQADLDYLLQVRGGPESAPTVVPGPVGGPGGTAVGAPAAVTGTGPAAGPVAPARATPAVPGYRVAEPVGEGLPFPPWTPPAPVPAGSGAGQPTTYWGVAQAPTLAPLLQKAAATSGERTELITCPECGEMAMVDVAHRLAEDFCRHCDFPLFWARPTVVLPSGEETGASLRRLPGTVGRAAAASVPCPHCGEPNSPTAEICVRCALSMHPVAPPPPEPVYVPEPEPEPEPEPVEERWPTWVLLVVVLAILLILTGMVVVALW